MKMSKYFLGNISEKYISFEMAPISLGFLQSIFCSSFYSSSNFFEFWFYDPKIISNRWSALVLEDPGHIKSAKILRVNASRLKWVISSWFYSWLLILSTFKSKDPNSVLVSSPSILTSFLKLLFGSLNWDCHSLSFWNCLINSSIGICSSGLSYI